jgi:Cys-tRNA(Pro)/Cys-tRNA(Cys) deacylase
MRRTRAIEILERNKVPYELREFSATEFTVEEAARELDLPLSSLFKTLLVRGERKGLTFALVPGDTQLSLSKLAKAMGDKRCEMVDIEDLFRLTGFLKGGCSPLGAKRNFPVYMDQSAMQHDRISVSAGLRGVQMLVAPADLKRVASATLADIVDKADAIRNA